MRITIVCLFILTGCSKSIHPNAGDSGPMLPDTGTSAYDTGSVVDPDAGSTGGTCGMFPVGSVHPVVHNNCGFTASQIEVLTIDCPHHLASVRLTIVCNHMYRTVPVASDPMEVFCDGGTFSCNTVLGANGTLTVECTSPASCSLTF